MSDIEVIMSPLFYKTIKKYSIKQKVILDNVINEIILNPKIGVKKKGELSDIFVYKFKIEKQENLLAYSFDKKTRRLIAIGIHENFYRDLKNYLY